MIFNSLIFSVFIVLVLGLYFLPLSWRVRKVILLVASLAFYGAWRPEFLLLILFSTLVDWWVGGAMGREEHTGKRRALLMLSLCSNLGLLAFFKYGNFALENVNALSALAGHEPLVKRMDILLPVGISFYTFQTLSYTIDIYRRAMKPWESFLDFALFVTFFPQLVAGPIVRAQDFESQCVEPRRVTSRMFFWGASLAVLGLFQKVVLSDALLASAVDQVYQSKKAVGMIDAWMGTFAFSGQIYFDFAGYSICAIGVAMMLGFTLPDNFRAPYGARGFSDFWRRWHISLSTWLRDYLYISLGGNRGSASRTKFNLFMTMLLGGLWHGASWNFVLWGALHGSFLIVERLLTPWIQGTAWCSSRVGRALGWLVTYLAVCVAWVPFRAQNFSETFGIYHGMIGLGSVRVLGVRDLGIVALVVMGMLCMQQWGRTESFEHRVQRLPWWLVAGALAAMIILTLTNIGTARAFIYFQF